MAGWWKFYNFQPDRWCNISIDSCFSLWGYSTTYFFSHKYYNTIVRRKCSVNETFAVVDEQERERRTQTLNEKKPKTHWDNYLGHLWVPLQNALNSKSTEIIVTNSNSTIRNWTLPMRSHRKHLSVMWWDWWIFSVAIG